jgi:cell division protein ZapA
MSDVTLTIGGRRYTLACAEGEEEHIAMLGGEIDARIASLPNFSRQSEWQMLLYAALLLADELHEAKDGAASGEQEVPDLDVVAASLEKLAQKLESVADMLEDGAPNT